MTPSEAWPATQPGVMALPSGRLVRGRGLAAPLPDGPPPGFGLYLLGEPPEPMAWQARWVRWPDFRLPVETPWQRRFVHRFDGR